MLIIISIEKTSTNLRLMRTDIIAPKPRSLLYALLLFLQCRACMSIISSDTLLIGQALYYGQSIVSKKGLFELGFFPFGTHNSTYLGIRYFNTSDSEDVVWVANRDKPLFDFLSLEFIEDGNLALLDGQRSTVWSTDLAMPKSNSTEAVLLDSGNFVLRDGLRPSTMIWESFDHPADTWLPDARIGLDRITGKPQQLISWKNSQDPRQGLFSFSFDLYRNGSSRLFMAWNNTQRYWTSGTWYNQTHESAISVPASIHYVPDKNGSYFTLGYGYGYGSRSRIVIDSSGLLWFKNAYGVNFPPQFWSDVYALCGAFGIMRGNESCECLPGFEPQFFHETKLNDWSGGCVRTTPLPCENSSHLSGKEDQFQSISPVSLPLNSLAYPDVNLRKCRLICLRSCSCQAYAYNGSICLIWEGPLLNLQLPYGGISQEDLNLRLAGSYVQSGGGNKWKLGMIIFSLILITSLVSCCIIKLIRKGMCKFWPWNAYFNFNIVLYPNVIHLNDFCISNDVTKYYRIFQAAEKDSGHDLLMHDFNTKYNATNGESNTTSNLNKGGKDDVELPVFSFKSVFVATGNFSNSNKLGEGGFGPVYKGMLLSGQEVAVKRLSKRSGQGLQEFKNEATLIARLQHRNLVRLFGCCIKRDEYVLIYEYMANKSLDFFLFDRCKREMLDWATRIRIIEGITEVLLYLHQHSRLRIIHRDMKPSNILLDAEMNPKISDFGMARIFGGNELQTNTNRIVGTYGYMAPEYAMEGIFSVKSDVFSFGVILLEIVSGRKNTGFYHSESLNLLTYAWELWNSDRALDLIDPTTGHPSSTDALLKYINIGLLCIQEIPADRPTMSDVVSMISNEHAHLPAPKQPAFSTGRNVVDSNACVVSAGICFLNRVSITELEAR